MRIRRLFSNKILILLIILLIGTTLRFYRLDLRSIWYDEAGKIHTAVYPFSLTEFLQHKDAKKPAYLCLLKIWMRIFGENEFAVRSLSVICGILSIFFLFLLASELFLNSVGLISCFFLSISPFHIYYSQQNLDYSLLLLLVILSTLFFLKIQKRPRKLLFFSYGIINILLCYTHMFGLYVVLIHTICLFLLKRKFFLKREWLVTQGSLFIAILPLFYFIFFRSPQVNEMAWISKPNIYNLLEIIKAVTYGGEKLAQGGVGFEVDKNRLWFARLLIFICTLLVVKGIFSYKGSSRSGKTLNKNNFLNKHKIIFLTIWFAAPVLATFIFSFLIFPIYVIRYLIIIMPAYLILMTIGILSIKALRTRLIILALMAILTSQALWVYFHPEELDSWREIAARVKKEISPGDMLVFAPLKQIVPFTYYFSDNPTCSLQVIGYSGKKVNGRWSNIFRENNYVYAGVKLGDLPYEMINSGLFTISKKKTSKIFLVAAPYWPGIGQCVPMLRNYFLKPNWKEDELFYAYPGVKLYIYKKERKETFLSR